MNISNSNTIEHIFRNIDKLSSIKTEIPNDYLRNQIFYHDVIIIDVFVKKNGMWRSINEGEEIDYLDEHLDLFNDEDSKVQSMGC